MSDKLPIDYARAESTDVVRKKFRRRVVMFVIATVVVIAVGLAWSLSLTRSTWLLIQSRYLQASVALGNHHIQLSWSPLQPNIPGLYPKSETETKRPVSLIGIEISRPGLITFPTKTIRIRYRTLFILAMIPWIIILIRLIRIWKRKRLQVDGELS